MEKLDLRRERETTRQAVHRAQRAILFNALAILCLALFAIWIARGARRHAELARSKASEAWAAGRRAEEELRKAHLLQARAERLSRVPGRRARALAALKAAARIGREPELWHEAVATLANYDFGEIEVWHQEPAMSAGPAFSPDFRFHLLARDATGFVLAQTEDRRVLHRFELAEGFGGGLGFSPDGAWVCCYTLGGNWMFWDARTFRLQASIPAAMHWAYALRPVFSPDSRKFVMCLRSSEVAVLELPGSTRQTLALEAAPRLARISPDGRRIAIALEQELLVRTLKGEGAPVRFEVANPIADVAWHPDGERVALSLDDGLVLVCDLRTGMEQELRGHSVNTPLLQFHPRGEVLLSASWDGTTRLWDATTGQPLLQSREGIAIGFDESGGRLAFQREGRGFGIRRVEQPVGFTKLAGPMKSRGKMLSVAFHPSQDYLAFCDEQDWYVGELHTRRLVHQQRSERLRSVMFSERGDRLLTSGEEGLKAYRFVRTETGVELAPIELESGIRDERSLERAAWARDGRRVVTVGVDKGFVLNSESLVPEFRFGQGYGRLAFAALSPDNQWVVASAWKGAGVCVWNQKTRQYFGRLIAESSHLDFDPSNRWLVTSNHRGYQLWEPGAWTLRRRYDVEVGSYAPGPARFNHDGSLLAVAPRRDTIELVNPETGDLRLRLQSPDGMNLTWLDFSRDGRRLAAATEDNDVQVWDLEELEAALGQLSLNGAPPSSLEAVRAADGVIPRELAPEEALSGNLSIGVILGGMALAVFFGVRSLIHQRSQMRNQARIEELAEEQNRRLLTAELELQQSQKMQALGTLAAGVAHDFNNLLSVVSLSNGFLKRGTADCPELAEETAAIDQAVAQGRQVLESMLGYSREHPADELLDLGALVEDSVGLLGRQFLSGIRLTLDLDRQIPRVRANPGRIEQILLNLIVNAGEAMCGQGKLLIRIRERTRETLRTSVLAPAAAGHYVELLVRDDGPGIPDAHRPRVFEPFYSTKQRGTRQGTGLGLSSVYAIAEREGYGIDLESAPGRGTCFRMAFPIEPARQTRSSRETEARLVS